MEKKEGLVVVGNKVMEKLGIIKSPLQTLPSYLHWTSKTPPQSPSVILELEAMANIVKGKAFEYPPLFVHSMQA